MAIDIKRSFYGWTDSQPIAMGAVVTIEGQGLVAVMQGNVEAVMPSTGSAGEVFVGFARFRQLQFAVNAIVEDVVVPTASPYTVALMHQNIVPGQHLVTGATPTAFDETHGIVTFGSADAGASVSVGYQWNMTVMEAKTTMYEAPVNMPDPNMAGQIGVGKGKSRIYTLHYDASVAYTAASVLKLGPKGIITTAGSGAVVTGARVVQIPSSADPYLGVEFLA